MAQSTLEQALRLAVDHHQAGRLADAEGLYRQILTQCPDHPEALHLLGVIANEFGQNDIAADLISRSIRFKPAVAEAHFNLGNALAGLGKVGDAIDAYRCAIHLSPRFAEAHNNLGNLLRTQGNFDDSVAACSKAIELRPGYADAYNNLAVTLHVQGKFARALAAWQQAIQFNPSLAEAYGNLGAALLKNGDLQRAVEACQQCVRLKPGKSEAYGNLGVAWRRMGELDRAVVAFEEAIRLSPQAEAYNNLANALMDQGRLDEALASWRRAISLAPDQPRIHQSLLFALHFHPGSDTAMISREHRLWSQRHEAPLKKFIVPHLNDTAPERRLKIGYVSPDFSSHPVGRLFLPVMEHHDRASVEVFCYATVGKPDEMTQRFRDRAEKWRNVVGVSDDDVAAQVRRDEIDILVDLALHTVDNRLLVFARKPAPLQVTWLGYPGITGMEAIDYRLTDPHIDPLEDSEGEGLIASCQDSHSERPIRLPESFWCYDPLAMVGEENLRSHVGPLPAISRGSITFASLNKFCKVNDTVLGVWARVLSAVPGSRLVLMAPKGSARHRASQVLSRAGVDPSRIEFVARLTPEEYLAQYNRIDIALDTFPYNGHTTSLDALCMGVPVVTLIGKTSVGRAGLSQLTNLKLTELVATCEDHYVRIATDLAGDLPRLCEVRAGLRQRMRQSPLTDAPRFARNMESVYRQMWRRWCEGRQQQAKGG